MLNSRSETARDPHDATVQERTPSELAPPFDKSARSPTRRAIADGEEPVNATLSLQNRSGTHSPPQAQSGRPLEEQPESSEVSALRPHSPLAQTSASSRHSPDELNASPVDKGDPPTGRDAVLPNENALRAWQDLRSRRSQLITRRIDKTQALNAVRRQREVVRPQQADLVHRLVEVVGSEVGSQLRDQLLALEEQQREQDSLERACEQIEDEIVYEEWQTGEIEDRFYLPNQPPGSGSAGSGIPLAYRPPEEESGGSASTVSVAGIRTDCSPEAQQYLSLVEDREIFRERLGSLRAERATLEAERSLRSGLGVSLDENSLQILAEFDTQHEKIIAQLDHVEAVLEELRPWLPGGDVQAPFWESMDSLLEVDQSPSDYYPGIQLLSSSEREMFGPLSATLTRPFFDHSSETIDMSSFINDWILYNLWVVEGEKSRYLDLFPVEDTVEQGSLGERILETWYHDDTVDNHITSQRATARSSGRSIASTLYETHTQSDSLINRRRRDLPLLRTSANTSAADLIARARQAQAPSEMTVL